MLKMSLLAPYPRRGKTRPFPGFVLSRVSGSAVAQGNAALSSLPAAAPAERRVLARRGQGRGENEAILNIL